MNPFCAAFVAEYTLIPETPRNPQTDEIAIRWPLPWRMNTSWAACAA